MNDKHQQVRDLILRGHYESACQVIAAIAANMREGELRRIGTMLVSAFNSLERKNNLGLIRYEDYQIGMNRVVYETLIFLDRLSSTPKIYLDQDEELRLYCSPEDFVFVFNTQAPVTRNKVLALSNFVDSIVFGDQVYCDLGEDEVDEEIKALVKHFDIDSVFDFSIESADLSFESPLIYKEIGSRKLSEIDNLTSRFQSGVKELLSLFPSYNFSLLPINFVYEYVRSCWDVFGWSVEDILKQLDLYDGTGILDFSDNNELGVDNDLFKEEINKNGFEHIKSLILPHSEKYLNAIKPEYRKLFDDSWLALMTVVITNEYETAVNNNLTWMINPSKSTIFNNQPFVSSSKDVFLQNLADERNENHAVLNDFFHHRHNLQVEFPILLGYLVSKSSSLKELMQRAVELRSDKGLLEFKQICAEVNFHLKNGDSGKAMPLVAHMNKLIKRIGRSYDISIDEKQITAFPSFSTNDLKMDSGTALFLSKLYKETKSDQYLLHKVEQLFQAWN